jgi:iron(II)-dependent oxidoreductase
MGPLVWDLGHIAAYEDLWLVHRHGERPLLRPRLAAAYDAFETPRSARDEVELLGLADALDYLGAVRRRTLSVLDERGPDAVLHEMVVRHELQHTETMAQAMRLGGLPAPAPDEVDGTGLELAHVPGGRFELGAPDGRFAYDNERPRHVRDVPGVPHRPHAGDQRDVADVRRGRRLRAARVVAGGGLGLEGGARHHPPRRRADGASRRSRLPRLLVRGRGLRPRARDAPAERGRVGEGRDLGPGAVAGGRAGVGVDVERVRGLPRVRRASVPRVLRGVLRRGHRVLRGASCATAARTVSPTARNWDLPERRQLFAACAWPRAGAVSGPGPYGSKTVR